MNNIYCILLTLVLSVSLLLSDTVQIYDYDTGRDYEISTDDYGTTLYDYDTTEYRYLDLEITHDNSIPDTQDEESEWNHSTPEY